MTDQHDWIDDISETDLDKLLPTADERSYPLIPSILGTDDEKVMDAAINELYDRIDVLKAAIAEHLTHSTNATRRKLAELVGYPHSEPSAPGSYKEAKGVYVTIESGNPIADYLRAQGLCPTCENPLNMAAECEQPNCAAFGE